MYKLTNTTSIIRISDNASIPADNANTDYQNYLAWVNNGNTAVPKDPPTTAELNAPIYAQLAILDDKSTRPLRENDLVRLADLNAQATALRAKLVK